MMKLNLQKKYSIIILSLVFSLSLLLGSVLFLEFRSTLGQIESSSSQSMERQLLKQIEERAKFFALFLSRDLVNPLYFYDVEAIYYLLRAAREQRDVNSVRVFDATGRIVHDGTKENALLEKQETDELIHRVLGSREVFVQNGNQVYEIAVPITLEDKLLGGVGMKFSLKEIEREIHNMKERLKGIGEKGFQESLIFFILSVILFAAVSTVLVVFVAKGLSRPISLLSQLASRIGRGSYDIDIPIRRSDEIGELADAFKRMGLELSRTTVSKSFVDGIIKSLCSSLIVTYRDTSIRMVNQATLDLLEYDETAMVGKPVDMILIRKNLFSADLGQKLTTQGHFYNVESILRSKGGRKIPVLLSGSVMRDPDGLDEGFVFVAQDITSLKQTQEQLIYYTRELERSNQELQDFASVASHDLQEPLRKVIMFSGRLQEDYAGNLGDKGRDFLNRMESAALRMRRFIDDLLEYSRVTTKARPFELTDLNEVVQGVVSDLDFRIAETKGKVEVGPLPRIEADSMQMHQLFQNIISNGLKFQNVGAVPFIAVDHRVLENGLHEICIKDNGIGFESQYESRIFKPFERLHNRDEYEGSGMGLSICKKIVERHGGTITASSLPNQGTIFCVKLPHRPVLQT